jgi:hypothetical protein
VKHIKAVNGKARRIEAYVEEQRAAGTPPGGEAAGEGAMDAAGRPVPADHDVIGLESPPPEGPRIPLGCSLVFSPGGEADSTGGTAGLCQPVERDLFDCHLGCFWPAQVPDQLNHAPDWTGKCAAAQKDWRKIDLIFP